jgi:hypothetical protein
MADEQLFMEAHQNGTFDVEAMESALEDIKISSYQFLMKAQLDTVGHKRFDFKASQLRYMTTVERKPVLKPMRHTFVIEHAFIPEERRLAFKRSVFRQKEITIFDCASNPELFVDTFITFVEGKFMDTVQIHCVEDKTFIIFDVATTSNPGGIPESYLQDMIKRDVPITVFFVPNCSYGLYNTNRFVLQKYENQLSLDRFNIINSLSTETKYITFVNTNDLLFSSVVTDTTNSTDMMRFVDNTIRDFSHKIVHLNIFGFRSLVDIITPTNEDGKQFFTVPQKEMPIPVENFIVFRKTAVGKEFAHDVTVKMYYPYHYQLEGFKDGDELSVYVFYFDDTIIGAGDGYTNDLATIYKYSNLGSTKRLLQSDAPALIRDYIPNPRIYTIMDYQSNVDYGDQLAYKIKKLKSWIADNPDLIRKYLKYQYKTGKEYYIECEKIDLKTKERLNNFNEVERTDERKTFNEPMYLFILPNDESTPFRYYRFFIDGLIHVPDNTYYDGSYEYYYIPQRLVLQNSIIEIERFFTFSFEKNIQFSTLTDIVLVAFTKTCNITTDDVFIVNQDTMEYLNEQQYQIFIIEEGKEIPLSAKAFKSIKGNFTVKLLDSDLLNVPLKLYIREHFYFEKRNMVTDDDLVKSFVFTSVTNTDKDHIRMFKNGRLVPNAYVSVNLSSTMGGKNSILPAFKRELGDEFVADHTPYKYKTVYQADDISGNGYVNLAGFIRRPFDLKWYDMYLNGRRLNSRHVDIISPTKIYIKNVNSVRHLVILEKDRDIEYFGMNANDMTITDRYWNDIKIEADLQHPPINDTEPDLITEIIDASEIDLIEFVDNVLWTIRFINPDLLQVPKEERDRYAFSRGKDVIMLNPDSRANATSAIRIFPKM